jgi:hypothetical protein
LNNIRDWNIANYGGDNKFQLISMETEGDFVVAENIEDVL